MNIGGSMRRIAIIPARSGSKGLKDKNVLMINGKHMMVYTIEAALESNMFDKIIVSSDSLYYGEIAKKSGAIFHHRDNNLALDNTPTFDVIKDILDNYQGYDYFVLLQPTSPLRDSNDIKKAIELFDKNYDKFDSLVSVCEAHKPSFLINELDDDMSLKNFIFDAKNYRRQKYKQYEINGAIFISKVDTYLKNGSFYGKTSVAFVMEKSHSIEVDDKYDFEFVLSMIRSKKKDLTKDTIKKG